MVNFCAVYECSNRSNREKDRSYFRLPAIITRSNDEKQALSKEQFAATILYQASLRQFTIKTTPTGLLLKSLVMIATKYNRAQERVEKRRRSEGAIALLELSKATMEETMDTGVTVEESNCKACQTE
ncbi:unnamed protein product, partial [Pocillopora meandrina]